MKKRHVILDKAIDVFSIFILSIMLLFLAFLLFISENYGAAIVLITLLVVGLLSEIDYYKNRNLYESEEELPPGRFDKHYHV